jgi:hypothetical protein
VVIMKSTIFLVVMLCSSVEVHRRFGGKYDLQLHCRRVSQTRNMYEEGGLKVEAIRSSETSVDFYRTNAEDCILLNTQALSKNINELHFFYLFNYLGQNLHHEWK